MAKVDLEQSYRELHEQLQDEVREIALVIGKYTPNEEVLEALNTLSRPKQVEHLLEWYKNNG